MLQSEKEQIGMTEKHVADADASRGSQMTLAELETMLHAQGWEPRIIDATLAYVIACRKHTAEQGGPLKRERPS